MKKKWLNKGSAVLLAVAMVLSLFPGMKGTLATVQAAENEEPSSGYWTDVDGLTGFELSDPSTAIGKIKFGANGRLWAICGKDGEDLALLSTSAFEESVAYGATSEYSKSNFVNNINKYLGESYFSQGEIDKMAYVTVTTNEPDGQNGNHSVEVANKKLYLPNAENQNSHRAEEIYVGSDNNIAVDIANKVLGSNGFQKNLFWLRSPYDYNDLIALVAVPGVCVDSRPVNDVSFVPAVVPAFNLDLSSVLFASAADAASSSYNGYKANSDMEENTYTLRYPSAGNESAVISGNGDSVAVTNANNKYLIVQNKAGMYAMRIDSDDKTVNARDIQMGSQEADKLENFNNCKVWVESTTDRITTARMAVTTINDVAVTDITAPAAGTDLDIEAACAVAGVTNTAPTVTWTPNDTTAGYNTTYTASVTLTTEKNYEFAPDVAATVNGNMASAAGNDDGTVTVTYEFPATAKAKLTSITKPSGITVENGTAYVDMGLPTNVAIVTEGNTETTAAVVWDTDTPANGSYNPALQTEQSVTLKGTVICPSNIDQNGVELTTTITVTIRAAEIVGTPTFAPAAGIYTENQSVELSSSTDGATIYYTIDETTPTTDSNVYSGSISVTGTPGQSKTITIKAIAVKSGMQTSSVASATYVIELPAPAKAKLTSITKPSGITVENGTAYADMGLPTNVAIVTEGNTETTAAVVWDTDTPVKGSYNPALQTEQSVTLKGTVICPSNIDQNGVELTTTITVTICAAEIVGTPTFAPAAGTYTENQSIELSSSTDGATIYYTIDETTPTADSDVYSGSISVTGIPGQSKTITIKAIAVKSGMQTSSVASATYVIELPAPAPTYTITAGAGGTHKLSTDETLTITCDGALDKLTGIYVDGNLVDPANYTLKSGSTILTFKAAYLNTLSVGTHKVKLQYNDGSVETTIVIKEASAKDTTTQNTTTQNTTTPSGKTEVPKTGDSTPAAWLFIVAIISGAGIVYFGKKKKGVR